MLVTKNDGHLQVVNIPDCNRSDDEKTDSIDAAFDSLVSLGDSCIQEGYQSGVAVSRAKGGREGLALGLNRGWDIGQEVGQIKAFAEFHLKLAGSSAEVSCRIFRNRSLQYKNQVKGYVIKWSLHFPLH